MRRLISLLLAATFVVSVGAPVAAAQSVTASYVSTSSGLRFSVPEGWQVIESTPVSLPVLEIGQAVLPGEGRSASVVVTQLNADISGMTLEDYKSALDQVVGSKYTIVSSSIQRIPATGSASGEWAGVLQVLNVVRDDVAYEHVQFMVPMADREYTIGVTGGAGTTEANANTAGFIAATLGV
jgi:hypothetical protein